MFKNTCTRKIKKHESLKVLGDGWEIYDVKELSENPNILSSITKHYSVYIQLIQEKRRYLHCKTKRILALSVISSVGVLLVGVTGYGIATNNYEPLNIIYQPCLAMACVVVWHYFRLKEGDDDDERDSK